VECRHHNYATTLDDVTDTAEKEAHLVTTLELWPQYSAAYTNLGVVYARTNRLELAVETWKTGLERGLRVVGGDRGAAITNVASGLKNLGRYEEALQYYEQAYELRPGVARVLDGLNSVRRALGMGPLK
jgi:tetratricopeptide (TPR) repeat protein